MLNHAAKLAESGCFVFPLNGKNPVPLKNIYEEVATKDASAIGRLWTNYPGANIAISCGKQSGITVIDIDVKNGKNGFQSLKNIGIDTSDWTTPTCQTPTGGKHFFFKYAPGIGNKVDLLEGVDIRNDRGYVVAAPSIHPDTKTAYEWITDQSIFEIPLMDFPKDLLTLCQEKKEVFIGNTIPNGSRNDTLFRLACSMRANGLPEAVIRTAVLETNRTTCKPPLPEEEAVKIAASASLFPAGQEEYIEFEAPDYNKNTLSENFTHIPIPECLPAGLMRYAQDVSSCLRAEIAPVVMNILSIASGAIGNSMQVQIGHEFRQPLFLWCITVGPSGSGKSPIVAALMNPIFEKQHADYQDFVSKKEQYDKYAAIPKKEREALPEVEKPVLSESYSADMTVEALADIWQNNPRGIVVFRDEIGGWIKSMDEYKIKGADKEKYLEAFNAGPIKINRVGRGVMFIPHTGFSLIGGIQPVIMRDIFNDENIRNGMLPRFLMTKIGFQKGNIDFFKRIKDDSAWRDTLRGLYAIPLKDGRHIQNTIHFSVAASEVIKDYFMMIEEKMLDLDAKSAEFLPKNKTYALRLAGVLQCLHHPGEMVIQPKIAALACNLALWALGEIGQVIADYGKIELTPTDVIIVEEIKAAGKITTSDLFKRVNEKLPEGKRFETIDKLGKHLPKIGFEAKSKWDKEAKGMRRFIKKCNG